MQLLNISLCVLQILVLLQLHVQFIGGILLLPFNWRLTMELYSNIKEVWINVNALKYIKRSPPSFLFQGFVSCVDWRDYFGNWALYGFRTSGCPCACCCCFALKRGRTKLLTFRSALGIWNVLSWDWVDKIIVLYLCKRLLLLKSAFGLEQTAESDFHLLSSF